MKQTVRGLKYWRENLYNTELIASAGDIKQLMIALNHLLFSSMGFSSSIASSVEHFEELDTFEDCESATSPTSEGVSVLLAILVHFSRLFWTVFQH